MLNEREPLLNKSSSSLNLSRSSLALLKNTKSNTIYNTNNNRQSRRNYKNTNKKKYNIFLSQPPISGSVESRKPKQVNKTADNKDNSFTDVKTHLKQLTDKINDNKKQIDDLRTQAYHDNLLLNTLNPSPITLANNTPTYSHSKLGLLKLKQKGKSTQIIEEEMFSRLRIENKKLKQRIKKLSSEHNINTYLNIAKHPKKSNHIKQMHVISLEIINDNCLSIIEQKDFTIKQLTSKIEMYMNVIKDLESKSDKDNKEQSVIDVNVKLRDQCITSAILKKIAEEEQVKLKKCRDMYKELKQKNNLLVQEMKKILMLHKGKGNDISNTICENSLFMNKNIMISERDNKKSNKKKTFCLLENSDGVLFQPNTMQSDLHSLYRNDKNKSKSKLSKKNGNAVLSILGKGKNAPISLDNITLGFQKESNSTQFDNTNV